MTWKVARLNKPFIVYIDRDKVDDVIFVEWTERNEKNVDIVVKKILLQIPRIRF